MEMFNKYIIEEYKMKLKTNKYFYNVISFRAVKDTDVIFKEKSLYR